MNDDTGYWKELFGDDYNEELMRMLKEPSQPDRQDDKPETAEQAGGDDDGSRFHNYDIVPAKPVHQKPAVNKRGARDIEPVDKAEDFDVNFDFEGEYRDVPDNRPVRKRREKRTGCLSGVIFAVFIICVSLLLASLLWLAATDVLGLGNENAQVQVTIPEDFTIDSVADTLHKGGLIKYEFLFKLYADFSNAAKKITPGTFVLNKDYDYRALVNGMNIHGGKRVEINVVIPEGYTLKQIFELFVTNNVCTEDELWDTATNYDFKYSFLDSSTLGDKHRLEGYLFPDTYTFYIGDSPTRALSKMLDNFEKKFTDEYAARAKELGYSVRDIINIASMIEKEAGGDSERGTIASVIYNRLKSKSFPHLQIDATINYAIAETGEKFSTDLDSPYNTYKVTGLPAGPIGNPGLASIKAALYPQTTKYYYYALNKNNMHNFFKDKDSFQAFINSDQFQSIPQK